MLIRPINQEIYGQPNLSIGRHIHAYAQTNRLSHVRSEKRENHIETQTEIQIHRLADGRTDTQSDAAKKEIFKIERKGRKCFAGGRRTNRRTRTLTHTHTYTNTHTCIQIFARTCTYVHINIHTYMQTCMHAVSV